MMIRGQVIGAGRDVDGKGVLRLRANGRRNDAIQCKNVDGGAGYGGQKDTVGHGMETDQVQDTNATLEIITIGGHGQPTAQEPAKGKAWIWNAARLERLRSLICDMGFNMDSMSWADKSTVKLAAEEVFNFSFDQKHIERAITNLIKKAAARRAPQAAEDEPSNSALSGDKRSRSPSPDGGRMIAERRRLCRKASSSGESTLGAPAATGEISGARALIALQRGAGAAEQPVGAANPADEIQNSDAVPGEAVLAAQVPACMHEAGWEWVAADIQLLFPERLKAELQEDEQRLEGEVKEAQATAATLQAKAAEAMDARIKAAAAAVAANDAWTTRLKELEDPPTFAERNAALAKRTNAAYFSALDEEQEARRNAEKAATRVVVAERALEQRKRRLSEVTQASEKRAGSSPDATQASQPDVPDLVIWAYNYAPVGESLDDRVAKVVQAANRHPRQLRSQLMKLRGRLSDATEHANNMTAKRLVDQIVGYILGLPE